MQTQLPVYVVDDDLQVLDSVKCLLRVANHDVHCFSNAKAFLGQLHADQTGCLITDLSMPEMDGFELQESLRSMQSMLSIIVVTGRADVSGAVRLMRNGAVTLLEKPYAPEQLLHAVSQSLALSERKADSHRQRSSARHLISLLDGEERDVISLAAEGYPNKAIAKRLAMSSRTVDRRKQAALTKLNLASPPVSLACSPWPTPIW